jgi:hypothetical protein
MRPQRRVLPDDLRLMYRQLGVTPPVGAVTLDAALDALPADYRAQVVACLREEIAEP